MNWRVWLVIKDNRRLLYISCPPYFQPITPPIYVNSDNVIKVFYIWYISRQKFESFLLGSVENELIADGVLAQDINQASTFWRIREVDIFHPWFSFMRNTLFTSKSFYNNLNWCKLQFTSWFCVSVYLFHIQFKKKFHVQIQIQQNSRDLSWKNATAYFFLLFKRYEIKYIFHYCWFQIFSLMNLVII